MSPQFTKKPTSKFQDAHEDTLAHIDEANPRAKEIVYISDDEEKNKKLQISTKRKNSQSDKISKRTNAQSDQISRKPKKSLQTLSIYSRPILDTPQNSCTEIRAERREVIKKVRFFREIYAELLSQEIHGAVNRVRVDISAYNLFKERFLRRQWSRVRVDISANNLFKERFLRRQWSKFLGDVPGVDSGDEFNMRVELAIVGVHRQLFGGIDFMKYNGKDVAISVVSTDRCPDDKAISDVLFYAGTGVADDDEVTGTGNIALKNSMEENTPIRVIRGFKKHRYNQKPIVRYVYDGLYLVEEFWRQRSTQDHKILMFQLRRIVPV